MKFFKEATIAAKGMPKAAWIAAIVLPGGFAAIGIYLAYKSLKKEKKQ